MIVQVLKRIATDRRGQLQPGQILVMHDKVAELYLSQGAVIRYDTKVIQTTPLLAAGEMLSALPVAQASLHKTLTKSKNGDSKKAKKSVA